MELLYTVPKVDQGSWVSLTVDPQGRLIAGDQYGGLYRLTVPPIGTDQSVHVELLTDKVGGAHGLLHAFGSLYAMVNDRPEKGLWRLRDTDADDQFDEFKWLRSMQGNGEHGIHAIVRSPDGASLTFANGNATVVPADTAKFRPVAWGEDHLLPRMWDPRDNARSALAPAGYIARTDPDARAVELFAIGFRNIFSIAYDQNGELFTYDSDMEWDHGSPWYMPTRINHVVSAGDYGWRAGAGRWPAYYADSLPAALDLGPGSPTGITFGTGTKFPAKYQHALFANDWTFGTVYAIRLVPDGASFRGEKEEFISGKPLPLTGIVVNPHDGALYFAVGGRRTQSALYRVTYRGAEDTSPVSLPPPTSEAKLRRTLEALHADGAGPEAVSTAWPQLASPDRFVRWAARVVIEKQPPARWAERALQETRPRAAVEALIALARVGDRALQPRLIAALERLDLPVQPPDLQLALLRAWQLTFTRMGKPAPVVAARLAGKFEPLFPQADAFVSRELAALLVYLDSPTVVAKTVPLLRVAEAPGSAPEERASLDLLERNDTYGTAVKVVLASRPDRQQIAYASALRNANAGWTPQLRLEYFSWFPHTGKWKGGNSFAGFLQTIRADALEHVPDPAERARMANLAAQRTPEPAAEAVSPKGPGRAYTLAEAVTLVGTNLAGRNFAQGHAMFAATACLACHRFNGAGGSVGPDLSGAANRYNVRDLLESIIDPSLVISDQYGSEIFELKSGRTFNGRVVSEGKGEFTLATNPFVATELARVKAVELKSRHPAPTSIMPAGLIDPLGPDELRDLVAYILSGGDANHAMFRK